METISVKQKVVNKVGGVGIVAEICGITQSAVSQWARIPAKHQSTLLQGARGRGIDLTHEDFFEEPTDKHQKNKSKQRS